MQSSLIAYIPVLNQRHLDWLKKYPESGLYLISQKLAEALVPRLARNIGALTTSTMCTIIKNVCFVKWVEPLKSLNFTMAMESEYILPDEDVSHVFAEKYIPANGVPPKFEMIWARWDMTAIKKLSPVMGNVETTTDLEHQGQMELSKRVASFSSDWFRQIGASVVLGRTVVRAHNGHFPTEYSPDIMGDPRINVDAGEKGKYTSFHAEKAAIIQCAAEGISTKGADLYTTVFPCEDCARAIVVAGIRTVFFEEGYSALDAQEVLQTAGVKIVQISKNP